MKAFLMVFKTTDYLKNTKSRNSILSKNRTDGVSWVGWDGVKWGGLSWDGVNNGMSGGEKTDRTKSICTYIQGRALKNLDSYDLAPSAQANTNFILT